MGLKSSRVLLFLLLLVILPFIRGCAEEVSLGFPLLTWDGSFNLMMFLLNLLFIGIIYYLFIKYRKYWSKLYSKKDIRWGIYSVILYHVVIIIGFFCFFIFRLENLGDLFGWLVYPIFMFEGNFFELGLAPLIDITIPNFYPVEGDIYFRIVYIITLIIYFVVGYFAGRIHQKIKPSPIHLKTINNEPEILTKIFTCAISRWKKFNEWQKGAIIGLILGLFLTLGTTRPFYYFGYRLYFLAKLYSIPAIIVEFIFQKVTITPTTRVVGIVLMPTLLTISLVLIGMVLGFIYKKLRKK